LNAQQIQSLLTAELPECDIVVEGDGGKFLVTAVGEVFNGLNPVKRQQTIYKILNQHIASGAIHAVTMRLRTAAEAKAG
jgi:acid stress-induced BolA-like protein IbaG/YrbA